jgi:hypothetical protein
MSGGFERAPLEGELKTNISSSEDAAAAKNARTENAPRQLTPKALQALAGANVWKSFREREANSRPALCLIAAMRFAEVQRIDSKRFGAAAKQPSWLRRLIEDPHDIERLDGLAVSDPEPPTDDPFQIWRPPSHWGCASEYHRFRARLSADQDRAARAQGNVDARQEERLACERDKANRRRLAAIWDGLGVDQQAAIRDEVLRQHPMLRGMPALLLEQCHIATGKQEDPECSP